MTTRRLGARFLASVGVAAMTLLAAAPMAAPSPAAAPDRLHAVAGLSVRLAEDLPSTAAMQTPYVVSVEALSTLNDLRGVTVSLSVTESALGSDDALNAFIGSPRDVKTRQVAASPVGGQGPANEGTLRSGVRATTALVVPAGGFGLAPDAPGVYGVVITMTVAGEPVWTRAAPLTWQPAALPRLTVTAVVSITGDATRVSSLLVAASDPRVTLLVDLTALTASQGLSLADREAYALPAANVDVTSVAHAGNVALIEEAVSRSRARSELPWIAVAAAADASTLDLATSEGAWAMIADPRFSSLLAPARGGSLDAGARAGVASVPVIAPHRGLSTLLGSTSPADSSGTALVVAAAAFEAIAGATDVVVAPGDGWSVDGTQPSAALGGLFDAPFVDHATLQDVVSVAEHTTVELPELTILASDAPANEVVNAVSSLSRLTALATATTGRSAMIADAERGLLESLSLQNREDPVNRTDQVATAAGTADAVLAAVSVTSGSQVLLVSSSGSVPFTVRNGLDVPVTVRVAVTSRSPILQTKDYPVATVEAGSETTVKVPVEAISSGDVDVSVALRSEEGATLAVAETLKVRVRAAWGNLATGLFTVALVVLLFAGILRTVRRGRKDTRLRPRDDAVVAGSSSADG